MELQTAIEILEYHQEWRLGKKEDMIHEPKKLTEALDIVIAEVKKFCLADVMRSIFPKKSNWIDIYMFEDRGKYKLIQMRYRIDNNKKQFRTASIGFVNDYSVKLKIYENVLKRSELTT